MSRLKWVEEEDAEGMVKEVYDQVNLIFGKVPDVLKVLSPWPEILELYAQRIRVIIFNETQLSRAVKEMIAALVSRLNKCDYCLTSHKSFLVDTGISSADAEAIVSDYNTAPITDPIKNLLIYVEKVTRNAYKVTDGDVQQLKKCGWSERQILEATLIVGLFSDVNRWVDALGIQTKVKQDKSE